MKRIENDVIYEKLKQKSKDFFNEIGDNICISDDFEYCLFLQNNDSWYIENEGWRDSNCKPEKDEKARLVLNFFRINGENKNWFKIFVPLRFKNYKLKTMDNNSYQILTETEPINGLFKNFDALMWDLMTGNAETESEIEEKYKLIGKK